MVVELENFLFSSMEWVASVSCRGPEGNGFSVLQVLRWVRFVLLAPCPQRAMVSIINVVFMGLFTVFALQRLCSRLLSLPSSIPRKNSSGMKTGVKFKATLAVTGLVSLLHIGLCIWRLTRGLKSTWGMYEEVYTVLQALSWVVFAATTGHEKKFKATVHPKSLCLWWAVSFILNILFLVSAIIRFRSGVSSPDIDVHVNDVSAFIMLPANGFLLVLALTRTTGITSAEDGEEKLQEPLLTGSDSNSSNQEESVTPYATAGILSRATWLWLNPLMNKGYRNPLKLTDVPALAPFDNAEKMYERFISKWPNEKLNHPVRKVV